MPFATRGLKPMIDLLPDRYQIADVRALRRAVSLRLKYNAATSCLARALSARSRFEIETARSLAESIETEEFLGRRAAWMNTDGLVGRKFLDLDVRLRVAVSRAVEFGLDTRPPCRILDLGCGTGYFLTAARSWGHDVLGLDTDDVEIFREVTRMTELPRVVHRIVAFQLLPDMGPKFDLMTAHLVKFNHLSRENHWQYAEWAFFLKDCRSRLADGGQLLVRLNPGKRTGISYLSAELSQRLRSLPGTTVSPDRREIRVTV